MPKLLVSNMQNLENAKNLATKFNWFTVYVLQGIFSLYSVK